MSTRFRLANQATPSLGSERELATQLQRRLRVVAVLWAVSNALLSLGGVALAGALARGTPFLRAPGDLFTRSPYFGVFLLVAVLHGVIAVALRPARHVGLGALRAIEWVIVAPPAALFAAITAMQLGSFLRAAPTLAIILAMGMALPWAGMMVVYGVFVPNTWRRCAVGVGLLLAAALIPDAVVAPQSGVDPFHVWLYLAAKLVALDAAAAFAVYGAYRIEELAQDALAARRLGQYVLGERLGAGGMGEVYLAEHRFLRRPCAVKLIRATHREDAVTLQRFEREVQATAALTHPNTIQIFDYGHADDGTFYYAMEYVPGLSLEQLVERHGAMAPARAIHVLAQLCGALREAHAKGLVHRDIKPGNVIIGERGGEPDVAKLLDFGLVMGVTRAGEDPRLTGEGLVMGTPAFMSPEQCAGDEAVGPMSDIYSLGALAYYLMTARPPFTGTPGRILAAHLHEDPAPMTSPGAVVPPEIEAVIRRCLAKQPAERFASVSELREALARCVGDSPWTARDARAWWEGVEGGAGGGRGEA